MAENKGRYPQPPVSEWKDITLPLGEDMPVLPGGTSERPVPLINGKQPDYLTPSPKYNKLLRLV